MQMPVGYRGGHTKQASLIDAPAAVVDPRAPIFEELRHWDGKSVFDLLPILARIPRKAAVGEAEQRERDNLLWNIIEAIDGEKLARWPNYTNEFCLDSGTYGPCNPGELALNLAPPLVWLAVDPNGAFLVTRLHDSEIRFEVSCFRKYKGKNRELAREVMRYNRLRYDDLGLMANALGIPIYTLTKVAQGGGFRYPEMLRLAMEADEQRLFS